jgi:integrase
MLENQMARRPRAQRFETRSARSALDPRPKPYRVTTLARGITLTYRRNNKPPHPWGVKLADGHGGHRIKRLADADDHEDANGKNVLDYRQAITAALALARGTSDTGKIVTIADALNAYERDLISRGQLPGNARMVRFHLTTALGDTPLATLTARDLVVWRDGLLAAGMKPATLVRICKSLKAALNLNARHDPHITNASAWHNGLGGISEDFSSRNVQVLDDDEVRRVIATAYAVDPPFGLYVEVDAVTGARNSQINRLTVGDLQVENGNGPRLLMPSSKKGRGRKPGRSPIPITKALAVKLQVAAGDRAPHEPLLLRNDGSGWGGSDHARLYHEATTRAGIAGTMTALRHSSITRALLAGVPIRVVAATHDTSIVMIEKTYGKFILDHSDSLARAALLESEPSPPGDNDRPLRRR